MFDGLLEQKLRPSDTLMTETLSAKCTGFAYGYGHGIEGGVYQCTNGETYYVPIWQQNNTYLPQLSQAQRVIDNPTGKVQDMKAEPLLETQLEVLTALRDAIIKGYAKAVAEDRLQFG